MKRIYALLIMLLSSAAALGQNPAFEPRSLKRAIPPVLLLCGAVLLGILLGIDYLKRRHSKPTMIGLHLLLGAGSLEAIAVMIRGSPDGALTPAIPLLKVAAGLLAFALFSGLLAPMVGRGSRSTMNIALLTHVTAAAAGFLLCLWWLVRATS